MATTNPFRLVSAGWRAIVGLALFGAVLATLASFLRPIEYASTVRLLILQTNAGGLDPYTALKSTERIAQNLGVLAYTSSFWNGLSQRVALDASYFPDDEFEKREVWARAIQTGVEAGSGVMSVTAYAADRAKASALAIAASQELVRIAPNYFGYSVRVQLIDDPLPSRFFARPNLPMAASAGALAGGLAGLVWIFVRRPAAGERYG